jgi:hypothetical protein
LVLVEKGQYNFEEVETKKIEIPSATVIELKFQITQINPNISKLKKKIAADPSNRKINTWIEDLAKLETTKADLMQKIRHEGTRKIH